MTVVRYPRTEFVGTEAEVKAYCAQNPGHIYTAHPHNAGVFRIYLAQDPAEQSPELEPDLTPHERVSVVQEQIQAQLGEDVVVDRVSGAVTTVDDATLIDLVTMGIDLPVDVLPTVRPVDIAPVSIAPGLVLDADG